MSHPYAIRVPRWVLVSLVVVGSLLGLAIVPSLAATTCSSGTTMNFVAHEDDDLLFMSPDLLHLVQGGHCVRTVFVTAGDDNQGTAYWQGRQAGSEAAYAQMAGVKNAWTTADAGISGHPMTLATLTAMPSLSLVFMHLPDGFPEIGRAHV